MNTSIRIGPWATTAIGSLPHQNASEAVEFVLRSGCDIVFWPQLPRKSPREWMVPQFAADLPGFIVDEERNRFYVDQTAVSPELLTSFYERVLDPTAEFALNEEHAAGFYEFLKRARGADLVKGQMTGPLTFTLGLNTVDGRPIHSDAELKSAALELLAKLAYWQAKTLTGIAKSGAFVFIDEPIYSALGTAAYLSIKPEDVRSSIDRLAAAIREGGASVGLHCCGEADWETVLSTSIDVLSFDSWTYPTALAPYANLLTEFLGRGGRLAWGAIPTGEEAGTVREEDVTEKLEAAVSSLLAREIPKELLSERSLLTPSCGCGSRSIEETERVFELLRTTSQHLRAHQ